MLCVVCTSAPFSYYYYAFVFNFDFASKPLVLVKNLHLLGIFWLYPKVWKHTFGSATNKIKKFTKP